MIDEWIIWMNWWIDELLNDWWMDNLDELMNSWIIEWLMNG